MRRRDILFLAGAVVVVILLGRIVWPLLRRAEGFQGSPPPVATLTECPSGSTLYMYEGAAYCCPGIVNPDAATLERSCVASIIPGGGPTFCAQGPAQGKIPNCAQTRAGELQDLGAARCPGTAPNYAQGPRGSPTEAGRCCAGSVNRDATDCSDPSPANQCDVITDPNIFKYPQSCNYLRAKQEDGVCPAGQHSFDMKLAAGPLAGLTVYGCTDTKTSCYSQAVVDRLKGLGYSLEGVPVCESVA